MPDTVMFGDVEMYKSILKDLVALQEYEAKYLQLLWFKQQKSRHWF
jgi:hypothetical protein